MNLKKPGKFHFIFLIIFAETYEQVKVYELRKLDSKVKKIKIPDVLLERLKQEFDESHKLSL